MAGINRAFFFGTVRATLFDGALRPGQVAGLTALLDAWEPDRAQLDDRWLAYLLGTTHHETGRTMQPIREFGGTAYFTRMYDPPTRGERPRVARELGNTHPGDGARYCGRGYVQLTGRRNYTLWAGETGLDLVGEPDLAMTPACAARILIEGSIKGSFTGRKLADFFAADREDWVRARSIINRLDKAELVAGYAKSYYRAISYTV